MDNFKRYQRRKFVLQIQDAYRYKPLLTQSLATMDLNKQNWLKAKFFRLSHEVVTCDVDRDVSTSSGDEVDWSCVIL